MAVRKGSKRDIIAQFNLVVEEYKQVHDQLTKLHEEGRITWGAVMVHGLYDNFNFTWMYGTGRKDGPKTLLHCKMYGWALEETKVSEYAYHLKTIKADMAKAQAFIAQGSGNGWKEVK